MLYEDYFGSFISHRQVHEHGNAKGMIENRIANAGQCRQSVLHEIELGIMPTGDLQHRGAGIHTDNPETLSI